MLEKLRVFVYGTLKPGEENYQAYCAGKIISTERAFTFGSLYALPAGYPAMTWGETPVHGYIYEFADHTLLGHLDELEDYYPSAPPENNLYNRHQIEAFRYSTSPKLPKDLQSLGYAWAYIMDDHKIQQLGGQLLPDGWWSGCNLTLEMISQNYEKKP